MRHQRAATFASSRCRYAIRLYFLPPTLLLLLLLTNASYFVSGSDEDDAGTAGYCRLCERHTMCLFPFDDVGPKCIDVENGDLDPEEIRSIVHQHNVYRNNIARGLESRGNPGPQPPARNIMELTWDDELALIARRWALQCNAFAKDDCRDVERFEVWQNVNIIDLERIDDPIDEDAEEVHDPSDTIEEDANTTLSTTPFTRIQSHVQSWLDEVEHFDMARVGLVDFAMENETSYVAIAGAMITRVGCGRAMYRVYLDESADEVEVAVLHREATDNKNDSGTSSSSRLEVLVCNYGPIDRTTPQNLYENGTLELCPEGSVPSDEYDHLCAESQEVRRFSPEDTEEDRVDEEGTLASGWRGIVGSASWDEERSRSSSSSSSAVSIALRKSTGARSSFHALAEFLSLVLLHIITKTPVSRCF